MSKSIAIALSLAITAIPAAPQTPPTGQRFTVAGDISERVQDRHDARRMVGQFFDAYRTLDVDRLVALFAADAVFEDPTFRQHEQGREGIRRIAMEMRATFNDVSIQVHSTVIDGDTVATEETIAGVVTHRDGRSRNIKVRSASFFRVRHGQIQKLTQYSDAQTFAEQMRAGG